MAIFTATTPDVLDGLWSYGAGTNCGNRYEPDQKRVPLIQNHEFYPFRIREPGYHSSWPISFLTARDDFNVLNASGLLQFYPSGFRRLSC
ncbi:hypothetical protein Pan161_31040 [Gimesia algae]|uniref:Uncharacterized protein n=1 Tax=Gimesia algae TaxID=2527971 RepID=A0A517VEN7_9PLAN|nr:hypothetical protein Pan161_31040 [Gimesia algae]